MSTEPAGKRMSKVRRGWKDCRCPHCGARESLHVAIEDVSLRCQDCDTDLTRADFERVIHQWQTLLAWLESAPVQE